jgi:hypothetical protein
MEKKVYFDVVLDALVPCQIKYRVLAESPEDALEEIKRASPMGVKPILNMKKNRVATIYKGGSSLIEFIKRWT